MITYTYVVPGTNFKSTRISSLNFGDLMDTFNGLTTMYIDSVKGMNNWTIKVN